MFEKIISHLREINGTNVLVDSNLSKFSTLGLNVDGNIIIVDNIESLKKVLNIFNDGKINFKVIGSGSNLILSEKYQFYLKLNFSKDIKNDKKNKTIELNSNYPLSSLTNYALKNKLNGFEVFTGIPATVGGAIYMNAGTSLGEIGEIVKSVTCINSKGEVRKIKNDDLKFSYRKNHFLNEDEIIVSVILKYNGESDGINDKIINYKKFREESQPLNYKSCGCVFKNYSKTCRAGKFIDIINLKGFKYSNIQISNKHANFFINKGNSNYKDMLTMIDIVKDELYLNYGIKFQLEVNIE